ncbi:polyamine ABC transporter substrate-binding protein [Streptomyces lomondensis]|uniref:ABC transporter substrate-binding protein n=2 Tax=Streptomyces lomondensis TaxID=68229 RepID=A0ABQ2XRF3_9ACTN|nr:ABC transporter substrate-binding protein [Streptomyces lomondensis]GGX29413.1 ABC transporter substrate-binding protein [Streptomyces lomondensis]
MEGNRIGRRTVLRTAGALAATTALAGCGTSSGESRGSSSGGGKKRLVVSNSGGAYSDALTKAIYEPFTKETGITVTTVNYQSAQVIAQVKQGRPQVDLMDNSLLIFQKMARLECLEPVDYDRLKNVKGSGIPEVQLPQHAVGKNVWASLMAYRTDSLKRAPKSWADFWNPDAFPGPRSLQSADADMPELEFALLADGVPLDKLYPLDVDRAFASMSRIRGDVKKFWNTGALPAVLLGRKEVVATSLWGGRADELIKQGQPVAYQWNGARRMTNGWGIPKGAGNTDAAYQLIDFSLRPEVQAAFAKLYSGSPVVPAAVKLLSEDDLVNQPTSPQNLKTGFDADVAWWDKNRDAVIKRWQEWADA